MRVASSVGVCKDVQHWCAQSMVLVSWFYLSKRYIIQVNLEDTCKIKIQKNSLLMSLLRAFTFLVVKPTSVCRSKAAAGGSEGAAFLPFASLTSRVLENLPCNKPVPADSELLPTNYNLYYKIILLYCD